MGQTFIILLTYYMMIYNLKIFYHFFLNFIFNLKLRIKVEDFFFVKI